MRAVCSAARRILRVRGTEVTLKITTAITFVLPSCYMCSLSAKTLPNSYNSCSRLGF